MRLAVLSSILLLSAFCSQSAYSQVREVQGHSRVLADVRPVAVRTTKAQGEHHVRKVLRDQKEQISGSSVGKNAGGPSGAGAGD